MRTLEVACVATLLGACASESAALGDGPSGEPIVVRLLDDGFVAVGGRRTTVEEFVFDLRVQCREVAAAGGPRPWLRVVARAEGGELGATVERLRQAAYDAGVQHVELQMEGE